MPCSPLLLVHWCFCCIYQISDNNAFTLCRPFVLKASILVCRLVGPAVRRLPRLQIIKKPTGSLSYAEISVNRYCLNAIAVPSSAGGQALAKPVDNQRSVHTVSLCCLFQWTHIHIQPIIRHLVNAVSVVARHWYRTGSGLTYSIYFLNNYYIIVLIVSTTFPRQYSLLGTGMFSFTQFLLYLSGQIQTKGQTKLLLQLSLCLSVRVSNILNILF